MSDHDTHDGRERCEVDGCANFVAGHETARKCWTHEGNWIDEAAYARGVAAERARTGDEIEHLRGEASQAQGRSEDLMRENDDLRAEVASLRLQLEMIESPPFTRRRLQVERDEARAEVEAWEETAKFYDRMEAAMERIVEIAARDYQARENDEDGPATICSLCAMGLDAHDEDCLRESRKWCSRET